MLLLAREMGVLKMGTVALDGTKIHANASRHARFLTSTRARVEAQLKAEVAEPLAKAEAADAAEVPDGMSIPEELAGREERLRKIAEARAKIEARAKERYERELAEHEAKLAARAARTGETGKKARGKPPAPPAEGPLPKDQINLTDEDSRIMPAAGGGFDQCYNAQEGDERDDDLGAHRVLGGSEEVPDLEGLFDPPEEQFDRPATFVKVGDLLCARCQVVGEDTQDLAGLDLHPPRAESDGTRRSAPKAARRWSRSDARNRRSCGDNLHQRRQQAGESFASRVALAVASADFETRAPPT